MDLVDMHSSWLVINSIVGCTNACKYCLLQDKGNNLCAPKVLGTPEDAVKELLEYKYYDERIPLCLFPNTDIFLNESNISYLKETLNELERKNVKNDLVIITKCLIPNEMLERLKKVQEAGRKIVIYLSYSGLDRKMEPNVNHDDILKNFQNLKEWEIPVVHYYRPLMAMNGKKEKIQEVLERVHQYTPVSATMGLMYVPTMLEKHDFWSELRNVSKDELQKATSIWPEEAWDYLYNNYDGKQFCYQTNTCALKNVLGEASNQYYGTYECEHYNRCDPKQRERCQKEAKRIDKVKVVYELDVLLKHLGYDGKYEYEFDNEHGLKITGLLLNVKTLAYLSYLLGIKVYATGGKGVNDIYNSTLNGSRPLVLRRR